MFQVDFEGKVLNTHQLKLLLAVPPMPVVSAKTGCEDYQLPERTSSNPQNISFTVLHPLGDHFLLSRSGNGIYIFDPAKVEVVLWNNEYKGEDDDNDDADGDDDDYNEHIKYEYDDYCYNGYRNLRNRYAYDYDNNGNNDTNTPNNDNDNNNYKVNHDNNDKMI